MEKKTAERLKQDFENKFDCYADTDNGLPIMAMTFDAVKAIVEQYAAQETAGMYTEAEVKDLLVRERLRAYSIIMNAKAGYLTNSIHSPVQSIQQVVKQEQAETCRNLSNTILQRNSFNADTDVNELATNGITHYLKP